MNQELYNIQPGAKVLVRDAYSRGYTEATVSKVTETQIVVGTRRFRRTPLPRDWGDHREITSGNYACVLLPFDQAKLDQQEAESTRRKKARELADRFESRDLRNRLSADQIDRISAILDEPQPEE